MTDKAVAYVRVSSEEQVAYGGSLAMQSDRLADYCRMRGLELVRTIRDEGVSGSVPFDQRRGGRAVAKLIADGQAQHVVALKLDRLFRDAVNALNQTRAWDKGGVTMHLVDAGGSSLDTKSAMGRLMLTVFAAIAEMERNLIGERTRAVLAHKRVKGEAYSPTPLGFRREADRFVRDDDEQLVVARIRALAAAGVSLNKIAIMLNVEGVPTKQGKRWHRSTLKYLLGNKMLLDRAA